MVMAGKVKMEEMSFSIPKEQADRLRRLERREPVDMAHDYLMGYYDDKRRSAIDLVRISIGWLPEVYHAMVRHIGRGGVSNYILQTTYAAMMADWHKLAEIPVLKPGHVEGAADHRKSKLPTAQPGRQSIVVPLVIPSQWRTVGNTVHPGAFSTYIKAAVQLRLEKELGVELPVQRGMKEWLGR